MRGMVSFGEGLYSLNALVNISIAADVTTTTAQSCSN